MPIVIRIRAKPSKAVVKGEMVVRFIVEPKAFMQRLFSRSIANVYFPGKHYLGSALCSVPHTETTGGLFLGTSRR